MTPAPASTSRRTSWWSWILGGLMVFSCCGGLCVCGAAGPDGIWGERNQQTMGRTAVGGWAAAGVSLRLDRGGEYRLELPAAGDGGAPPATQTGSYTLVGEELTLRSSGPALDGGPPVEVSQRFALTLVRPEGKKRVDAVILKGPAPAGPPGATLELTLTRVWTPSDDE